jgi:hypothetical protein
LIGTRPLWLSVAIAVVGGEARVNDDESLEIA